MAIILHRAAGPLHRSMLAAGALAIVASVSLAVAPGARAADVERHKVGSCSNNSNWELSLEREHGQIEIDLDVDTPKSGRTWIVRLWHDGVRFAKVTRVTDRDGEFEVDRVRSNHAGPDRISFKAVNRRSGETCAGFLRI